MAYASAAITRCPHKGQPAELSLPTRATSAPPIVAARERHRIDLIGPARPDQSWQKWEEGAFHVTDFAADWERQSARCPEGHESATWRECKDGPSGRLTIKGQKAQARENVR